jgi:hypothetical protein
VSELAVPVEGIKDFSAIRALVLLPVEDPEFELLTSRLSVSTAYWALHNNYPKQLSQEFI